MNLCIESIVQDDGSYVIPYVVKVIDDCFELTFKCTECKHDAELLLGIPDDIVVDVWPLACQKCPCVFYFKYKITVKGEITNSKDTMTVRSC